MIRTYNFGEQYYNESVGIYIYSAAIPCKVHKEIIDNMLYKHLKSIIFCVSTENNKKYLKLLHLLTNSDRISIINVKSEKMTDIYTSHAEIFDTDQYMLYCTDKSIDISIFAEHNKVCICDEYAEYITQDQLFDYISDNNVEQLKQYIPYDIALLFDIHK